MAKKLRTKILIYAWWSVVAFDRSDLIDCPTLRCGCNMRGLKVTAIGSMHIVRLLDVVHSLISQELACTSTVEEAYLCSLT